MGNNLPFVRRFYIVIFIAWVLQSMVRVFIYFITNSSFMKKTIIVLTAMVAMWACNKDDSSLNSSLNATDQNFIIQASYSNHAQINGGQLAVTKAVSDSVKAYSQRMISDYSAAQQALDSIGVYVHVQTPQVADTIHQVLIQEMGNLSGIAFDTTYMRTQVTDHQNLIALYQYEINTGSNIVLKNYANVYLITIQSNYNSALSIAAKGQ